MQVSQAFWVDEVARLFGQRAVQADDLGLPQQLRQLQVACTQCQQFGVRVGVVRQQLTAKTGHDAGKGGTDLAGANHPDGFPMQVEAGQPMQAEITFASAVVGTVQAAVKGQDQGHGMFGHGMWRVGRHPDHGQAQAFCCTEVHMVVTGRAQGDQARAASGQALEHRRTQIVVDERADHFMAGSQRCGVLVQACWLEVQL
ncbi:hypothetical protein D3C79_698940 [compost metagenome]